MTQEQKIIRAKVVRAAGASKGITYKHSGVFRGFIGMQLRPLGQARAKADAA